MALLLLIIIGGFCFVLLRRQIKQHKQGIRDYLYARGATNITISTLWFDRDRDTSTYDVQYWNSQGTYCRTSCKIGTNLWSNGEIYWSDPPQ